MRVNSTAVNMLAINPMMSVTANPLIGPVPYWSSKRPPMNVVTWPSKIEENAFV